MRAAAQNDNAAETPIAGEISASAFGPLGTVLVHDAAGGERSYKLRQRLPGATVEFGYATAAQACAGRPELTRAILGAFRS